MSEALAIIGCFSAYCLYWWHKQCIEDAYDDGRVDEMNYQAQNIYPEVIRQTHRMGFAQGRQSVQQPCLYERN